jgi:hypothetical protein
VPAQCEIGGRNRESSIVKLSLVTVMQRQDRDHRQMRSVAGDIDKEMMELVRRIVRALARADAEEEHNRQVAERERGHDHSG